MSKKLGVAIIGCGKISQTRHIPEYLANPNTEILGYYDWNQERAIEMETKFGGKAYETVEELLSNQEIELISVCVANVEHASITIQALKAKKHVLCEKPMGTTLEECQEMVATAKAENLNLMIDQNQRLAKAHIRAKKLIEEGIIGKVLTFKTTFGHAGPETWSIDGGSNTWFFDKNNSKYGAIFDLGVHKIDVIQYILNDKITSVSAILTTLNKRNSQGELIEVDDNAMGIYQTKQGILGNVTASWTYYGEEDNSTFIYGTEGIMKIYDDPTYSIKVEKKNGEKVNYQIDQIQTNDNQTNSGIIDEFVSSVIEDRKSISDAESVLHSMKVTFASAESSQSKKEIIID